MTTKTLPNKFRRARFDWEVVERRKKVYHTMENCWHKSKKEVTHYGLFRQDKHWVVAEIHTEEGVERLRHLKTYMPNEEHLARKEYESK